MPMRNVDSRFALNPTHLDMPRSRFTLNHNYKTTFNCGELIPFLCEPVLPGDTFKVKTSMVVRMQTLVAPIMDNVFLDYYLFFCPSRLVWEHWQQFMGENTSSAWVPQVSYTEPQIQAPASTGWTIGTIADYMGLPVGIPNAQYSALPLRAYARICDEWFRSQSVTDPLNIPYGDSTQIGTNGSNYINDVANGGAPFKVARFFDMFSSCLPAPQAGPDVSINIADVPVVGNGYNLALTNGTDLQALGTSSGSLSHRVGSFGVLTPSDSGTAGTGSTWADKIGVGVPTETQLGNHLEYSGLKTADSTTLVTIAQLRQAFQVQKFFEARARGGLRYIEQIREFFGVVSPDSRMQRTEYLGGARVPININSVIQTSETGSTPMGDTAAYSVTSNVHEDFTRSFVEHGYVIGVMCARYKHSYQQGVNKMWLRKTALDYYWPTFASISEQPVYNEQIYAQGPSAINPATNVAYDKEVFGYQEPWAEYRFHPDTVTGEMRSSATTPLDMWHLADNYQTLPSLSDSWIREDKSNLDRALAVTSAVSNQFWCDIFIENVATRPMPVYSVPGLIDHH